MPKLRLALVVAILAIAFGTLAHGRAQAKDVTADQARQIAASFVGQARAAKLQLASSGITRRNWSVGKCYRFETPLGVKSGHSREFMGNVWVEAESGRVLQYDVTDLGYADATGYGKQLSASRMIGPNKAVAIATGTLHNARISMLGKRAQRAEFHSYQHAQGCHSYVYQVDFQQYTQEAGVGEIELPVRAHVELNAVTGELLRYDLYEQPLRVKLVVPTITKQQAVAIVRMQIPANQEPLYGKFGTAEVQLAAGIPTGRPLSDTQRFYWRVTISRKTPTRGAEAVGSVDAVTGELLGMLLPAGV